MAYLNNLGGPKEDLNEIARKIWSWCYRHNNWITATHLPGVLNTTADTESRSVHDNTEWKLHPKLFDKICQKFGTPDIDLFASRLNNQLARYCSWKPDPGASAVDCMSEHWGQYFFYAFPHFNMIGRVLKKVETDQAKGLIVVPYWPTQAWFSKFTQMCNSVPSILFSREATPTISHPWRQTNELPAKMRLLIASISGKQSTISKSQHKQSPSSWPLGELELKNNTRHTLGCGISFVMRGIRVQCKPI